MWSQHSSKTFVNVAHQSKWEQQISISGNISTSSAKLPIKTGNLQVPPVGNVQPLPRSCWDLGAAVKGQRLQSRRLAQNLEKICGAIDTFAVVAKAPGARWHRKDWTTKISIQSDTVATDSDIDPPKLSPIEQHPESIHMWSQHSSKTFVNVDQQSKWEQQINFRKHLHILCQATHKIWQSSGSASRHRAAAAMQLLGSGSSCWRPTSSKSSLCPELPAALRRHRCLCCRRQSTWCKVRQEGLNN